MTKLARIGVSLNQDLLEQFDQLCRQQKYSTRSKAISDLIREALKTDSLEKGGQASGAIILVYNHHHRGLVNQLTNLQHDFHGQVICNQHVHLDNHLCMEMIAVEGVDEELQQLADRIHSLKGVLHCSLDIAVTE